MELTKLENAIALSTILNAIDKDNLEEYVELKTLRLVVNNLQKLNDRTTPEKRKKQ
ncbi:DXO/RAI1 family decapping nuclease [Bacillus sp. CDB3]|uniref:DXO/RAI1 family decapping nuclease n=1 Tax=Bacillus sp. CDB3 TaxID=360310 RepID=UPI002117B645|nr:DXO/RAI1 family decapping nuclease [Bacillus sp. CDB3]